MIRPMVLISFSSHYILIKPRGAGYSNVHKLYIQWNIRQPPTILTQICGIIRIEKSDNVTLAVENSKTPWIGSYSKLGSALGNFIIRDISLPGAFKSTLSNVTATTVFGFPSWTRARHKRKLDGFNSLRIRAMTSCYLSPNWNSMASKGVRSSQAISITRSIVLSVIIRLV